MSGPLKSLLGGTIRHDIPDSQYLTLAGQPEYASVGQIDTNLAQASGVLIGSHWVLTAGHVASISTPSNVTFALNGTTYTADDWFAYPSWDGNVGANGYDLALVHLTAPITTVAPAVRYTGSSELGATATIVGYGLSGTGLTGQQPGTFGTKRAGYNVIDALGAAAGDSNSYLLTDFDRSGFPGYSSFGSTNPLALEYTSAQGDSGGGLFITDGGIKKLAGITSYGQPGPLNSPTLTTGPSGYGDIAGFTRVSAFNSWIDDQIDSRYWKNPAGGTFGTAANWNVGAAAGATNIAAFASDGTYTVHMASNVTNKRLRVRAGDVTFDLHGSTYSLTNSSGTDRAVQIDRVSPNATATLTITNGTLSSTGIGISTQPGSRGALNIASGATLNTSGSVYVGGVDSATGTAFLTIGSGASAHIAGTLKVWDGGNAQIDAPLTVGGIDVHGGTIMGSAPVTLTGAGTLHYGSLIGTNGADLIISPTGALHFDPISDQYIGRPIQNSGRIFHSTPIAESNPVHYSFWGSESINNLAAGTFIADSTHTGTINVAIDNAGNFIKAGPAVLITLKPLTNRGTITVQQGTLALSGDASYGSGVFAITPGATLQFGPWGTHTFPTSANLPNAGVALSGVLSINGDNTFSQFTWSSGTLMGAGKTIVAAGGSMLINNSDVYLARSIDNAGTIFFNSALSGLGTTAINNLSGAMLDMNGGIIGRYGSAAMNNAGSIRSRGVSTITMPLTNTGSVNVDSGTLSLYSGTSNGTFIVTPGAHLAFRGNGFTINNPTSLAQNGVGLYAGSKLTIAGNNTFADLAWEGGTLAGAGTTYIKSGGTVILSALSVTRALDNRTIENAGNLIWTGNGTLTGYGSASIVNLPGATIDLRDLYWLRLTGSGVLKNQGTLRRSGFNYTAPNIGWLFDNSGTISVESGAIELSGGGTYNGGTVLISPGATLTFGGGTHRLLTPTFLDSVPFTLAGATLSFNGENRYGSMKWAYGTLAGAGRTVVPADQTVTFNFPGPLNWLNGRTLENAGRIVSTGPYMLSGDSTAELNNLAGATIEFSPADLSWDFLALGGPTQPQATLNNSGLVTKTAGNNRAVFWWKVNNAGTIDAKNGSIVFAGDSTHTGTLRSDPGGTIVLERGTHIVNGANLSAANVLLGSGTLQFTTDVSLSSRFFWEAGTISGIGKTSVPAGVSMTMFWGEKSLYNHGLDNAGTLHAAGYLRSFVSGSLNNLPGATLDVRDDAPFDLATGSGSTPTFTNGGLFQISLSSSSTYRSSSFQWRLNNTGTVELHNATLSVSGPISQMSGATLTGGTWNLLGNATLIFSNTSNITTIGPSASVWLDSPTSTFARINTLNNNQGRFTITGGRNFTATGGLSNSGTITVGVGSTLKITGTLTNPGTIDVGNAMIVDYSSISPIDAIRNELLDGFSGGAWTGQGVLSTLAAADASRALGYWENTQLSLSSLGGLPIDGTAVIVAFTYGGDSNNDQRVDIRDLYALASHYNSSGDWYSGDFNYDQTVNTADLTILARNWQAGVGGTPTQPLDPILSSLGLPSVEVPEPGSVLVACFLMSVVSRRSRSRHCAI